MHLPLSTLYLTYKDERVIIIAKSNNFPRFPFLSKLPDAAACTASVLTLTISEGGVSAGECSQQRNVTQRYAPQGKTTPSGRWLGPELCIRRVSI